MAETFSRTDVIGELVATMEPADLRSTDEVPFRLLLIGDWSGRANRALSASREELETWRPRLVDRDNLEQLIARLGVKLHVPLASDGRAPLPISFNSVDDFHPDRLLKQLDIFESLRHLRVKLSNPKTFAEAAAEVREWSSFAPPDPEPPQGKLTPAAILEEQPVVGPALAGNLLDQILAGGAEPSAATKPGQPAEEVSREISELARAVVHPYLTPDIGADQDRLMAAVDTRIAGNMNAILHHPDFQALESAWRALDFLVSRLESGTDLNLYLLDISFDEFKSDLRSTEDFRLTALYKLLVEQTVGTPGGIPWAAISGNYLFDFAAGDAGLVEAISMIAREAGAPFISATTPHLLGCESLVDTPDPDDWRLPLAPEIVDSWQQVTALPSSGYVGFGLPRFLLRLPYGQETDPTEEFDFEEFAESDSRSSRHERYLWANPSFAIGYLLAKSFGAQGWSFRPSDSLEIEDLPLHVYKSNGDTEIKPCAEILLTMRAAEKIIDQGLIPLLSMKNSGTIRLGMFQSISRGPLRGRWGR
jgi:type VI secretion system protein ImpC